MTKIKNRFNKREIITVHDNILSDLYELDPSTIQCREINGEEYLVNEKCGRGYLVGLRTKIPGNLLISDNTDRKYLELSVEEQEEICNKLKQKLYFNNQEILFTNILLDKFLNCHRDFDISFKEIESHYRKKASSYRNIVINDLTYKRYITVINEIIEKDVYLKTKETFRKPKYGVNNRNITQPFLVLLKQGNYGKNNLEFSYSFGQFGNVLKLSRRYSNNLIRGFYRYNLNQSMKHAIAYHLGKEIFIRSFEINHNILNSKYMIPKTTHFGHFSLDINGILQKVHYETRFKDNQGYSIADKLNGFKNQPNKNRTYRMVMGYIQEILGGFCSNKSIYKYDIKYIYNETEAFEERHEFDYDLDGKLNYEFSLNDINQDVDIIIDIYITEMDYMAE